MNLIGPFIYGIGTGFLMSILLGAIFFMLIQAGIKHGHKKGFTIAAGVITGDIIYIVFAIAFTEYISSFIKEHSSKTALLGGIVLAIMGISAVLKSRKNMEEAEENSRFANARDYFLKPFFINIVNPANAAWWLGLYSLPPALDYNLHQKIAFALGAIMTVYFTEVGIAYAASKLKKFTTPRMMKRVDVLVGIVFIVTGLSLFAKAGGWF